VSTKFIIRIYNNKMLKNVKKRLITKLEKLNFCIKIIYAIDVLDLNINILNINIVVQ